MLSLNNSVMILTSLQEHSVRFGDEIGPWQLHEVSMSPRPVETGSMVLDTHLHPLTHFPIKAPATKPDSSRLLREVLTHHIFHPRTTISPERCIHFSSLQRRSKPLLTCPTDHGERYQDSLS